MTRRRGVLLFFLVLGSACSSRAPQQPSAGVAYAGPLVLNLRKDFASKTPPVGTAKHGDRLEVIETRRRFVKVRTAQGVEGWTDSNLLLTPQQMDDLHRLADAAAKFPSQGTATVLDALNMHTEPSRQSPSFFQIPESGAVDVIGHRVAPHVPVSAPVPPPVRRAAAPKKSKGKDSRRSGPVPPMPTPPAPPQDWQRLSRPRAPDLPGYAPPASRLSPPALDDWDLVRTRDGKSGWVLSRMLTMAIPDEVAQHAEGHRITAYMALGDVKDKDKNVTKHNWLWTTVSSGQRPYEFDSFRVFVWSTKRHRYETAFIERNVKGYYPIGREALPGQDEAFSVVLEEKDGNLYKRTYGFTGYHVRMFSKTPYQGAPALPEVRASRSFDPAPVQAPAEIGWTQKMRDWRKRWIGR
jgi:uncharacterized protein YgiM (DUF1202 family)